LRWRSVASSQDDAGTFPQLIVQIEERALSTGIQRFDIVHRQCAQLRRCRHRIATGHANANQAGRLQRTNSGMQQMRPSATRVAPQIDRTLDISSCDKIAKQGHQFGIAPGIKIFEGRCGNRRVSAICFIRTESHSPNKTAAPIRKAAPRAHLPGGWAPMAMHYETIPSPRSDTKPDAQEIR
jgi:hypothetical protein